MRGGVHACAVCEGQRDVCALEKRGRVRLTAWRFLRCLQVWCECRNGVGCFCHEVGCSVVVVVWRVFLAVLAGAGVVEGF